MAFGFEFVFEVGDAAGVLGVQLAAGFKRAPVGRDPLLVFFSRFLGGNVGTGILSFTFPIFAMRMLAGRLIKNPMIKAMIAIEAPVVNTAPNRVASH